ncbi:dual specificity phosphatase 1 isoform X1 [Brachionus plicatilis]|uniref:protein-tyrosine-phosphatase n=1 Tax=Brachionus plicatilis TaxID=10195 RepID=A0A3M7PQL7_BRAPC|nr:dual specificity phosphatase 1 isoform X1 [Brachionus plicatilis]
MKYYKDIFAIVEPFLYLGGNFLNKNPHLICHLGFTHVINIADTVCPNEDLLCYLRYYKYIPAEDKEDYNIRYHFEEAFQVIDHARLTNGKILVHCKKGKSRSATIIIAYLMSRYNLSYHQAYQYVQSRKSNINPNDYFIRLLCEYDKELKGDNLTKRSHLWTQHNLFGSIF